MRTVRTVATLRAALSSARSDGSRIGFVPTMGALHEGHLSLIRRAGDENDIVVVSLFVNPTQFNEQVDLEAYPRDEYSDAALADGAGADLLFAPTVEEVYPNGSATTVQVRGPLTETLEGAERGFDHFDGVTTVVAKLLAMVGPHAAYFGRKDAQQSLVVRRMVGDLNLPVRIEVCPIVRDTDGLALSSRNARLSGADRARALALSRGLRAAADHVADGTRDAVTLVARARAELQSAGIEPEYLALVDADDFSPVEVLTGATLLAVAARVGDVRLIDNILLSPISTLTPTPTPDTAATR